MRPVYTYAARCGDFVKVGRTGDIKRRLAQLQVGNPLPVTLHGYCARDVERSAHEHLEICGVERVHGEWFRWDDETKYVLAGADIWPLDLMGAKEIL